MKEDSKIRGRVFKLYPDLNLDYHDVTLDITLFELFEDVLISKWVTCYFEHARPGTPIHLNRQALQHFVEILEDLEFEDPDADQLSMARTVQTLQIAQELSNLNVPFIEPYITLYTD